MVKLSKFISTKNDWALSQELKSPQFLSGPKGSYCKSGFEVITLGGSATSEDDEKEYEISFFSI